MQGALPPAATPRRRRAPAGALAVALAAATLLLAAPAEAHDSLLGSEPPDGAVLPTPPTQVVLTFSEPPSAVGAEVLVQGPGGALPAQGAATVDGVTVTQALAPDLPAGDYAVTWRAVSGDGHPVTGTFAFSVTATSPTATPTPATPTPATVASPTPSASPSASPSADPRPVPSESASPAPSDAADSGDGAPWRSAWPWLIAVAVVVAAAAAATVRRRGVARD